MDKIPYEVIGIVSIILLIIEIYILIMSFEFIKERTSILLLNSGIVISILMGFFIYITIVTAGVTTIRRIKAHVFWKNTVIYHFLKFTLGGLFTNLSQTVKLLVQYGGFILISCILGVISLSAPIVILFLIAFWYYVFKKMLDYMGQIDKVRQKIKNMYYGDIQNPLKENELYGELKQVARELNDISGGLSKAIEEATKSERLKTELITNVSHDIKTPLTSIINYVDLMKQEKIDNPTIQEYLKVLDSKSQRLKKLTEDLIEASKASSGNIKLTMEPLNVKELVKQVRGEFENRFSKIGLEIIETFPEEDVTIEADSRYLYRVMENMYVNISKYALENSRVYIDVIKTKGKIQIALKNISKDKLNISVNELMERFVRGDESRTNEGSGLGISIAKSLTELQGGKFDIYLDGDLFKVVIEFEEK
ncbi:MAG: HAMP domain-containing histidine kinase [Clostridia bacterium]|nr:HAMP domain-containing histidine kinase [Clostridia bacterium]